MRLDNAMLLLSSLSLLSVFPLSVVSLPIRIVVVEKLPIDEAEGFMRSVRIGHPAAVGANFDDLPSRPIDALEETDDPNEGPTVRILPFYPEADSLPFADHHVSTSAPVAIPMTPADESDLPFAYDLEFFRGAAPNVIEAKAEWVRCKARQNSWKYRLGRVENWFRELFGLSTIAARSVNCQERAEKMPIPPQLLSAMSPTPIAEQKEHDEILSKLVQGYREACEQQKKSWRAKMGRASNWVRVHLGLEAILEEPSVCRSPIFGPLPVAMMAPSENILPTFHRVTLANSSPIPPPAPVGGKPCHNNISRPVNPWVAASITASGPRRRPGFWRPRTFTGRLQKALYSLSPWEGRALAFVLGCGLGVLLRMVYVFILLGVRAWQSRNLKRNNVQLSEDSDVNNSWQTESIVDAVILFDAASIKSLSRRASMESLQIYNEKQSL